MVEAALAVWVVGMSLFGLAACCAFMVAGGATRSERRFGVLCVVLWPVAVPVLVCVGAWKLLMDEEEW